MGVLKKLGWDKDLTPEELATIERIGGNNVDAVSWAIDLSGGIQRVCLEHGVIHYGNGKARANAWNLPDPIPVHREPIYSPRPDLVAKYPTRPDERQFRMPNIGFSVQKAAVEQGHRQATSRSSSPPAASSNTRAAARRRAPTSGSPSCSRTCSSRSTPATPPSAASRTAQWVWVLGPENQAQGPGQGAGHRAGRQGRRLHAVPLLRLVPGRGPCARSYPQGTDPIVLGESVNTVTTYGFDPVTGMQEAKVTLCQIRAA